MKHDRQVVLDTETTGLEVERGHRVIEIGCVELRDRRLTGNNFHRYVNPERAVDVQAAAVHGLTDERLSAEPLFAALAEDLWVYLDGAELIIHNATFDVGFLDHEFARSQVGRPLAEVCAITDTVLMARKLHPGQRASLDALCRRYGVDNSKRALHGALLDAQLLAEVYLAMTGGQVTMTLEAATSAASESAAALSAAESAAAGPLVVIAASAAERQAHTARLATIKNKAGHDLWSQIATTAGSDE